MEEYHVTYQKVPWDGHPAVTMRHVYPFLQEAYMKYDKMILWDRQQPALQIQDIKITKRIFTEEDVTPTNNAT